MQLSSHTPSSGIGGTASSVVYPQRSSFTVWSKLKEVVHKEGTVFALFRGNLAATYLWAGYTMVQFAVYGRAQHVVGQLFIDRRTRNTESTPSVPALESASEGTLKTLVAFLSGASAGTCATLTTYPFDLCRTTFAARGLSESSTPSSETPPTTSAAKSTKSTASPSKPSTVTMQPPRSISAFVAETFQRRGLRGFYAGSVPAVLQIIPYMGLNFSVYEYLTRDNLGVSAAGYAGSVAGAVSKVIVYPMDTVKRRLQAQSVFGVLPSSASTVSGRVVDAQYTGMIDCARKMYRVEGTSSFYRGIVPAVMKNTIATGLSFAIFRASSDALGRWL